MEQKRTSLRLDQWLWYARFYKTRTLASTTIKNRKISVNDVVQNKPSTPLHVGDEVSFVKGDKIWLVQVLALAVRRGPFAEASLLYKDISPIIPTKDEKKGSGAPPTRDRGTGRPTKKERRAIDRLME